MSYYDDQLDNWLYGNGNTLNPHGNYGFKTFVKETKKSYCVTLKNDLKIYLPKSKCTIQDNIITMPKCLFNSNYVRKLSKQT